MHAGFVLIDDILLRLYIVNDGNMFYFTDMFTCVCVVPTIIMYFQFLKSVLMYSVSFSCFAFCKICVCDICQMKLPINVTLSNDSELSDQKQVGQTGRWTVKPHER